MIPIFLDPDSVRVAVIGSGALAVRRAAWLRAAGAEPDVFEAPPASLQGYHAVWIAGIDRDEAVRLAALARAASVLVNVEDDPPLCDFHTPAVVHRGRLTLAAGTGGASPAVARAARERLEAAFPERWEQALEEIALSRATLRQQHASFDALVADARARLAAHDLL